MQIEITVEEAALLHKLLYLHSYTLRTKKPNSGFNARQKHRLADNADALSTKITDAARRETQAQSAARDALEGWTTITS